MGAKFSLVECEKLTWIDHTIVYDETVRSANLQTVQIAFPDDSDICLAYQHRNFGGLDYQHWFITDREGRYYLEFGSPSDFYSARVQINTVPHSPFIIETQGGMNGEVRERMLHVLGMSNYSLCLRNCEHVANYVFRGRWVSFQMDETNGTLMTQYFKNVIVDENRRKVNTFPSSIRPHAFTEGKGKKLYSFIQNHYNASHFSYYLDHNEDTYNILVIGPTGAGKSHLINVFFNQPVCDSCVSHKSVTKEFCFIKGRGSVFNYQTKKYEDRRIVVADTVGLCDTEWDDAKIVSLIKGRVSSNFKYIDAVFVVFRADRLLKEHVRNMRLIMEWLGYYQRGNQYLKFLFVGTFAENLSDEDKSRLGKEASEILGLKTTERIVPENGDIPPVKYNSLVYTGFPPETSLNERGRGAVETSWDLLQPLLLLSSGDSLNSYYGLLEKEQMTRVPRIGIPRFWSKCNIL